MANKYLDGVGLGHMWGKIKEYLVNYLTNWKESTFGIGKLDINNSTVKLSASISPAADSAYSREAVFKLGYNYSANSGIIIKDIYPNRSFGIVYMNNAQIRPKQLFEAQSSGSSGYDIQAFFICGYIDGDGSVSSNLAIIFAEYLYDYIIVYEGKVYYGRTTSGNFNIDSIKKSDGKKHPYFGFMVRVTD